MTVHFAMDMGINAMEILRQHGISEQSGRILPEYDKRQSLVVLCPYKIRRKRKSV